MLPRPRSNSPQWFGIAIGAVILAALIAVSSFARSPGVGIVAFTADWCAQCHIDKHLYPNLRAKWGSLTVADYDKNAALAQRLGVRKLPAYVVVRSGKAVAIYHDINDLL